MGASKLGFLIVGSALLGIACGARVEVGQGGSTTPPTASVEAAISAVTLGDDCGGGSTSSSSGIAAGDCAEPGPSSSADSGTGSYRGGCGGYCQQSNVQVALNAVGTGAASIVVVETHLVDATTGARLDDVDTRNPRRWDVSKYVGWDGKISAGSSLKVTYDLSQFDWKTIGGGNPWATHGRRFKLELVLRIDGTDRTLLSGELSREPEVAT